MGLRGMQGFVSGSKLLVMGRGLTIYVVLVAGLPLDQKVVQYGPFVLNSQEEVYQAMLDYQSHSNGFERAAGWESKIGKSMVH